MLEVYSREEAIVCALARDFKNGEVGFTGLATGAAAARYITALPLAAMQLARQMHAPDLTILFAGWLINPDLSKLEALPTAEFARELRMLPCESRMQTYPGPYAVRRGDVAFGFGSGVQVDREGNVNSTLIGDPARPDVALVGSILLPEHMALFGREYLMMPTHSQRSFVERVDYVSGVGFPGGRAGRADLGLGLPRHGAGGGGPRWIVSPLGILEFGADGHLGKMYRHADVSTAELSANTGFELPDAEHTLVIPEPEREELELLRRVVDPRGVLVRRPELHSRGPGL